MTDHADHGAGMTRAYANDPPVIAEIKRRLEWVAINSDIATDSYAGRQDMDDDDEAYQIAKEYYGRRNDLMREIHRLLDELVPAGIIVVPAADWIALKARAERLRRFVKFRHMYFRVAGMLDGLEPGDLADDLAVGEGE